MSGLETAIRNALQKSDRADPAIRARIYQSARHALDAGLAKQGVTDGQVIAQQKQRLELAIRTIEVEERAALQAVRQPAPGPMAAPAGGGSAGVSAGGPYHSEDARPPRMLPQDAVTLGGTTRGDRPGSVPPGASPDGSTLDFLRAERMAPVDTPPPAATVPADRRAKTRRGRDAAVLDAPPERAAKPRRRRGFLAVLSAWLVVLALAGGALWWAYSSGLVEEMAENLLAAADRPVAGGSGFEPQIGFSEDWIEIFDGRNGAAPAAGSAASVERQQTSAGEAAIRLSSSSAGADGDIAIEVPVQALREMAGTTSTMALTLQSDSERPVQFSVRCDFGSLGQCPRHRFTARQESAEALFRVSFDQSLAPNTPGRLILNAGLDEGGRSVLLHSVRVLPGQ